LHSIAGKEAKTMADPKDDPYEHRDDGTYIVTNDGRESHISSDPDAEGDDGTGRNSDGGAD
jgi:hypothetical protein